MADIASLLADGAGPDPDEDPGLWDRIKAFFDLEERSGMDVVGGPGILETLSPEGRIGTAMKLGKASLPFLGRAARGGTTNLGDLTEYIARLTQDVDVRDWSRAFDWSRTDDAIERGAMEADAFRDIAHSLPDATQSLARSRFLGAAEASQDVQGRTVLDALQLVGFTPSQAIEASDRIIIDLLTRPTR